MKSSTIYNRHFNYKAILGEMRALTKFHLKNPDTVIYKKPSVSYLLIHLGESEEKKNCHP